MKVTELMIGDLVTCKKWRGNPFRLTRINDNGKYYYGATASGAQVGPFLIEEIVAIPLTAEILEKNGWVRTKYSYGRDCMEIHGADKLPEGVDNALSMARWSIDKNYQYHFLDLYMWEGSVMQHNVHYVHQLQHAFRIFGIEKEIEL